VLWDLTLLALHLWHLPLLALLLDGGANSPLALLMPSVGGQSPHRPQSSGDGCAPYAPGALYALKGLTCFALRPVRLSGAVVPCELNRANPFDYLTELQRHSEELKRNPSEWMPLELS
jgi:hypothetical protein